MTKLNVYISLIFLSTQVPSSYLTVTVFVVRASILSSSRWSLPTIIWVTAPTLATPTHAVVAFRSGKEKY